MTAAAGGLPAVRGQIALVDSPCHWLRSWLSGRCAVFARDSMDKSALNGVAAFMGMIILAFLAASPATLSKDKSDDGASVATIGAVLAGRYENSAQVARDKAQRPPPQHVTVTIESTPEADWELWRVHMDVDADVAESAGSDTSLDAVWAMNISRKPGDASFQFIPYTLRPSVDIASLRASAFDKTQWLPLEACALRGSFRASRLDIRVPPDEMCVAVTMGLGGKRAFLPNSVEHEGDWLHVQLMYFGRPWRVDARRVTAAATGTSRPQPLRLESGVASNQATLLRSCQSPLCADSPDNSAVRSLSRLASSPAITAKSMSNCCAGSTSSAAASSLLISRKSSRFT